MMNLRLMVMVATMSSALHCNICNTLLLNSCVGIEAWMEVCSIMHIIKKNMTWDFHVWLFSVVILIMTMMELFKTIF